MISPMTASGTKVAFIRAPKSIITNKIVAPFRNGDEVTIEDIFPEFLVPSGYEDIFPEFLVPSGYAAHIAEGDRFYCLSLFRHLELPKSITDCLNVAKLKQDADATARLLFPY